MRLLAALLIALAPLVASAQSTDACDVAGVYRLDREPILADVIASMNESLEDLGERPDDESFATVEWDARDEAYRQVLSEARAGEIVPHMSLELKDDGTVAYRILREDKDDEPRRHGRWTVDSACKTMTIDLENDDQEEAATVQIEGNRLVFEESTGTRRGALNGVAFDRVRR
ncbi:MAG: hypothetical protein Rubg2KO_11300 [Rubricoccaceae bacterium]